MNGSADFQRAFLSMRYFWGARGAELSGALDAGATSSAAADLLQRLGHAERDQRATALAVELGRLATALEQRSLWR